MTKLAYTLPNFHADPNRFAKMVPIHYSDSGRQISKNENWVAIFAGKGGEKEEEEEEDDKSSAIPCAYSPVIKSSAERATVRTVPT